MRAFLALGLVACGGGGPSPNGDDGGSSGSSGDDASVTIDAPATTGGDGLHVVMGTNGVPGHLVDGAGAVVKLHGADRAGTEYACLFGNVFDGPSDQASIDAIKSWHLNALRVPLNEDCWLGINGVPAASSGQTYRDAIRTYVSLIEANNMYVILDLHWAAPGTTQADSQLGMADADHAPTFWTQVATAYAGDRDRVIFDLFNEPFITDWDCWLRGGTCAMSGNTTYAVAGMQQLYAAVRATGADNVVMMGGLSYSSDFTHWLDHVSQIPAASNIAVSWHTYSDQSVQTLCPTQYNGYSTDLSCADAQTTVANYGVPPLLAAGYPIVVGEIGIGAYKANIAPYTTTQGQQLATWLEGMLTYLDAADQSYVAWDWNTEAEPLLITSFDGTPTPYFGTTYKAHLAR